MDPNQITKPVVLRRRSANYPGRGRRIHGIVFDHPSMPKIMAVSSVVRPLATNHRPSPLGGHNPKRYATTTATTIATTAQHGSPPALIHSPTTPMAKCRSPYDAAPCLPLSDTSRQPRHVESRAPSYQQMWSPGQTPNYVPPSTSLANTLNTDARPALGSEGTSMAEHSHSYFQQEKSMVRRADPTSRNQSGRHEPTSARDEVDRHFELPRQPMAPRVSRGNPETVADHPHLRGNAETVAYTRANPEAVPHHPHPRGNLETAAHPRGNPETVADHPHLRGNPETVAYTRANPEAVPHHPHTRGNPETVSYSRGNSEAVAHYPHLRGNPETVAHTRGNPEAVAHHPYPRGNPETVAHPRGSPEKVAYTCENTETVAYTRGNPEAVANHSRGNLEAVANHPRIVTQSPSHGPYFQTPPRITATHSQYSPSFSNAAQLGNARFYLAQHVTRRNSTGTLRHYPSNVNGGGGGGAASEFEPRYGDERHADFSRQFHHNVLLESHPTPPQGHHHVAGTSPSRFVAPPGVTSTKKPRLIRQSSVPAGVSTFSADQFRRRATWDSYSVTEPIAKVPAAMAPATGEKDPGFYRPPSQASEVVTSPGGTWTTRESTQCIKEKTGYGDTPEYTRKRSGCEDTPEDTDRLGYRDTPEYTKGWSGYTNIPENTKGRWEPEDILVRKKLERTKRRRLRKKESSTVVVISDSENEQELEDGNDCEDSGSDVFPVGKCEELPVILLGGLVTNKTKVKSEHVSEHDKTTRFDSAYWTSDSRERDLDSRKGRLRSVVSEDENTKDSSEKKSVVLGERGLCTRVKSETNVKRCIDVCEKSFVEDFRVTSENTSRSVVNIRRSSSSRQCHLNNSDLNNNDLNNNARSSNGGKMAADEDRKMPLSYREPAELPVSVNTVRAKEMAVHSKLGGNICRSEKAPREAEYGCEPSRVAKCSHCRQYYGCSSDRGNFYLPQKNPSDVSETCAACPLRNRSSSPTFGLLSRQLSKLTNDEIQTQIKKGECIVGRAGNGENTRGRETSDGKSPYGVRDEVIYGTDKIPGNLQVSTKTEARDECNRRSCDYPTDKYECPGTKCKLSDATTQKAVYKPTGIVVGVKKDLRVEELLVAKTVDGNEFGKHDGKKTKGGQETNDGSENAEKEATRNEFSRGFGVLQFSVVEKDVGANWRNGHECPKSRSDEVNATQQWQAYSVKLERGSTIKQCDKVLGQVRREEVHRRGGPEQSVLKYMRQGEVLRDLDTKERDVSGITDANSTHQDTTSAPKVGKKCEMDTFAASAFQNAKSVDAKNVGDSRETRELSRKECNVVVRKRSSSFDAYDDCGRTRSPEKRQKIIEGNFERDGSDCDGDCARTYSAEESKRQRTIEGSVNGGEYTGNTSTTNCEGMAKLSINDQPIIANHVQKTNYTHIAPRPEAQNAAAVEKPAKVHAIESRQKTSERSNDPGDVSPDKKSPVDGAKLPEKKGGALTASEWKEILIGRIEQVRESIETEQTPWKTKNKTKVLKKLENQLAWWGAEDEQAFLSRKLQFFQTMRNQYELMKEIGAQRRTSTKNTGKKVPEWTTTAATKGDDNPKTKVLKVANVTKAKKQSKWTAMGDNVTKAKKQSKWTAMGDNVTKAKKQSKWTAMGDNVTKAKKQSKVAKKTSTSTGKKRGRPLKKVKNVEA